MFSISISVLRKFHDDDNNKNNNNDNNNNNNNNNNTKNFINKFLKFNDIKI